MSYGKDKKRILSGARPTGPLHLGNYHGAVQNWIALQKDFECFYFIADWHSLTTDYADPSNIKKWTESILIDWLAAGLNPESSTIFIQSLVPEHAELHLLLSMLTPLGWLERVPSYKEMREQLKDRDLNMYGFLGYPLLQTADIVIYRAYGVPVGEDQVPHVELAREIARRFNSIYGKDVLIEPQAILTRAPKIPGTDGRKMSKSYKNCIYLSDSAKTMEEKILPAMTDPARKRRTDPGNPDLCPIFEFHKLYTPEGERKELSKGCRTAGIGCIDCKKVLIGHLNAFWEPIREKRKELEKDVRKVWDIAFEGSRRAREEAKKTMEMIYPVMGIDYGKCRT